KRSDRSDLDGVRGSYGELISLLSDRGRRSVLFCTDRRRSAAAFEAGAALLIRCACLPFTRALRRMRARDQLHTESAKQCRQLAHEGNALGRPCRRSIFRERGSWQENRRGESKNNEQSAHIMSPFMS